MVPARGAPHVAGAFRDALLAALRDVEEHPLTYPKIRGEIRRSLLRRFPYAIFFLIEEDMIVVLAVSHQARSEQHWQRRST